MIVHPSPETSSSASQPATAKARLTFEFLLAALLSAAWYFTISTRYGTRDREALREAVAARIPTEAILWIAATIFWVDLGLRMKSRVVLYGAIAICLLMARGIWSDLAFVGSW